MSLLSELPLSESSLMPRQTVAGRYGTDCGWLKKLGMDGMRGAFRREWNRCLSPALLNIPVTKKPVIRSPGDPFERLRAGHCDEPPVKENRRLMLIREEQAAVRPWGQYPIGGVDAGL
jgi:hypothetical protein